MKKQSTVFKSKKLRAGIPYQQDEVELAEISYHELLVDSFKIFCNYRFYHSHHEAMNLRKEELKTNKLRSIMNVIDDEDIFLSANVFRNINTKKPQTMMA